MTELKAGIYRHYKGPLYLVLGLAHDANADDLVHRKDISLRDHDFTEMGEREVVVYVGLQLDGAHGGARMAVRTRSDFEAHVCGHGGCKRFGQLWERWGCAGFHRQPRFEFVGERYDPAPEEPVRTSDCDCGVRLGEQHRPSCTFMRKLEANSRSIVRCEHGVDRARVNCPACGVQA